MCYVYAIMKFMNKVLNTSIVVFSKCMIPVMIVALLVNFISRRFIGWDFITPISKWFNSK